MPSGEGPLAILKSVGQIKVWLIIESLGYISHPYSKAHEAVVRPPSFDARASSAQALEFHGAVQVLSMQLDAPTRQDAIYNFQLPAPGEKTNRISTISLGFRE